ncbi:MerR family transcriptional regulator [Geomicrobium sp. JSM 1781026]|uniref:MerR family transcriptional regulator n=1 Tax=Geomicrobium sp. JSM 1781026 TaxID=3344580 RepID=UPI0035BFBC53
MLKVKQVSQIVGISVRTLHHYDEIGLLVPDTTTEAGYRLYSEENLKDLQQILFFKELGLSLKSIKEIITNPGFDHRDALMLHRKSLEEKKRAIVQMIETIDRTLDAKEGEIDMTDKKHFAGFDFSEGEQYEKEARDKWGDKAVDEAKGHVHKQETKMAERMNDIYRDLATMRDTEPTSQEAQQAIATWYVYLNELGTYSLDAFAGLGKMYVADERFKNNIDQFGEGLAAWMQQAMRAYAEQNK